MNSFPSIFDSRRRERFAGWCAHFFGAGLLPGMPGTWGSLAALPLAWLIVRAGSVTALTVATLLIFILGVWASSVHSRILGGDDPSEVVIDEVAGQWMVLLVVPLDLRYYALAFVLFRLADVLKPWPVSLADRRIKGGFGIMFDDILAAVYAIIPLIALRHFLGG